MSDEPTLADLKRQADKLRQLSKRKRVSTTNKDVQEILNVMEEKGSPLVLPKNLNQDTIDTLAVLGITARILAINCVCDRRESCRVCENGPQTRLELGPRPYETPQKWGID